MGNCYASVREFDLVIAIGRHDHLEGLLDGLLIVLSNQGGSDAVDDAQQGSHDQANHR